ncbi:ribosome maturation factor RimM [Candidatus Williamhamiltonella defendens]|uniref:Ribosome maturation factor RimM n=2 Tax=Candidatus Williamhamiltonella defendens TaxID=138072 RepID=A0A2D3TFG9_9ENTR|nr:ribosome maturation factor RimM [Candidatus Hamiltonella defensa]ACQ68862.1 16S rRNA processing protein [Candidatus Hamiltonella defensa 5AT (Acyrthosiphon pisum)]ASV34269.1 ribosome maturation factor RimM [Candidatus Hamiltonella defensa]ATW23367.1 ribosome maturation factor RimM [Candidatus Hamiltonella defensa]ATW30562.1 ribosome maturation factor RimM [Candidatus Hamiltonella defensa]ATW32570.1 ribosome maturation factor RimM [Candidatus Hamiltonella defensa]
MTTHLKQPVIVGKIGSTYSVRGWLKMFSFTEKTDSIFDYQPWFIQHKNHWQFIDIEDWKCHQQDFLLKIKNIDEKEKAQHFVNAEITVDASQLPVLEEGDYYWKDIIGCQVIHISGDVIGTVVSMIETGANDVMVVQTQIQDHKSCLVPFLCDQVVKKVDKVMQQIQVDWDLDF